MAYDGQKIDERDIYTSRDLINALQDWGIMDPNAKDGSGSV